MTPQEEIIEALERAVGYYVRESQDRTYGAAIRAQDQNTAEALQLVLEMFKRGPAAWRVCDANWNECFTTLQQAQTYGKNLLPLYALAEKVK